MIVVGLAMVVLLGALALGLDWGYGLTQRRVMQNAADAAALAVGKALATNVVIVNNAPAFRVSQEQVYCQARQYAQANLSFSPAGASSALSIAFLDTTSAPLASIISASCPAATSGGTDVPSGTRYVRATSGEWFTSLVAGTTGTGPVLAQASSVAKLSGTTMALTGKTWPMVRHYNPDDFDLTGQNNKKACGNPCDPTQASPIIFWSPSANDAVYGNFKGLLDFSRYSTRYDVASQTPQLLTQWDQSGSLAATPATAPKVDQSGNCGGSWDTAGDEDPQNNDKQCSIPNWFYYPFGGVLSLSTSHATPAGQEAPSDLGNRTGGGVCATPPPVVFSCGAGNHFKGDWIETATGNIGSNASTNMGKFIHDNGDASNAFAQTPVPGKNGIVYGASLTMLVYLWDCAETFSSSASLGSQWDLLVSPGPNDCSQVRDQGPGKTPARVHLFTAAAFTFYEGLVDTSSIEGFWGGFFGDPGPCQSDPSKCQDLNALANTAFLVSDTP
jgi:Flp pilus assembly protein TadG